MFQPIHCFIGFRYSQSRSRKGFVSFITFFSIVGILLGVASLILVVSVMNGFEGTLKNRVLGLIPHVVINVNQPFDDLKEPLLALPEVANVVPFEQSEALVQSSSGMSGILIQGIDPEAEQQNVVQKNMIMGDLQSLSSHQYNIIIGHALARKLNVSVNDKLRLILPNRTLFTPMGRIPMQRAFTVSGVFNVGSQVDDAVVYIHYVDAQKLQRKRAKSEHQIRLYLHDAFHVEQLMTKLNSIYAADNITTWQQSQGSLFSAVKMEKNIMWLMLSLIIAVAAFNIVSALIMVVNDKQGEISILQTMGMSKLGIVKIFITQGMINSAWGVSLGAIVGLLLTFNLNSIIGALGINIFGAGYASQTLPIQLEWQNVVMILMSAFAMSFLATLYPAYRASATLPAEVLRNE